MDTPICEFVRDFAAGSPARLHMPGHKGKSFLGAEPLDITEVDGADSLYEASGIIKKSEDNAGSLFGCPTFYSAEGSSLAIRAMLYLASLKTAAADRSFSVLAGRNAHKTFLSAAALLDAKISWLYPESNASYLTCAVPLDELEKRLRQEHPDAVYITSPDYLGNMADIAAVSALCRKYNALLLVDNAHGAYLRFLPRSLHPMDLGADMCCASAHKTLPVLTGGAYLHIAGGNELFCGKAKAALSLFGSTSPSYLIMQSLDMANAYLTDGYKEKLAFFTEKIMELKNRLAREGYTFLGDEPLKLTIAAKKRGYTGKELAELLKRKNIVCEFADPDHLVLMLTPELDDDALPRLEEALAAIPAKKELDPTMPAFAPPPVVLSPREALMSDNEDLPTEKCAGRILASANIACPPAVPVVVCGEKIEADAIACMKYYGITNCCVVKKTVT